MGRPDSPSRSAVRWLESGLLDVEFYAALRGRAFAGAAEAAEDLVAHGMGQRLSPHPFLDFFSLPPQIRRAWRQGKVGPVLTHLAGDDDRPRPAGPLAAPVDPVAARASSLALARRLGHEADVPAADADGHVDWPAARERRRQPGLASVVLVTTEARRTLRTVEQVLHDSDTDQVEVVVVDHGSAPHVALALHAALYGRAGVRLLRVPSTLSHAAATNHGLARSEGRSLALLAPHLVARPGWLVPLLTALDDPAVAGAQPLVLRSDDTIDAAGLVITAAGGAPSPLLAGHPKEDALRLRDFPLAAVTGEAMVVRAEDVIELRGLTDKPSAPETTLDLCARLLQRRPGGFRLAPDALAVSARGPENADPYVSPPDARLPTDPQVWERAGFGRARQSAGQLRWSLKLPSPPGRSGDVWGDTYFADAFAKALRGLGQDVVTCRRGAHGAGPTHLDDVAVAVRGLYPIAPLAGQVNVLWVISHPDDVDPRELDGYDLVCAASTTWSAQMSAQTGREVFPLLQASEFQPPTGPVGSSAGFGRAGVVYVGNATSGRERPLVRHAVDAGVDLAVYGRGWEDLPSGVWRGKHIDNHRLPELYHHHGIVLSDHWPDMARHGFVANRVFDAVAAGARVICDDVAGVYDVFDRRDVAVARTPDEVAAAVAELGRVPRSQDVPRPALSFHDRARSLLARIPGQ